MQSIREALEDHQSARSEEDEDLANHVGGMELPRRRTTRATSNTYRRPASKRLQGGQEDQDQANSIAVQGCSGLHWTLPDALTSEDAVCGTEAH